MSYEYEYEYEYESRITGITYPSAATHSFTYNGLDTRVEKVDSAAMATYRRDGVGGDRPRAKRRLGGLHPRDFAKAVGSVDLRS